MSEIPLLVSAQWLAQNYSESNLKIIDCRFQLSDPSWGYQQYIANHIPNAYFLDLNQDLSSPVAARGGRHPLPDFQVLAEKLAAIGIIYQKTPVVVYDDARFAFACRLWWLLRYMGHEQVALLDGGWSAWQKEGYPISSSIPARVDGSPWQFSLGEDWTVDWQKVQNLGNLEPVILVDARDGDRYRGEREPIDPVAGHIPGAINFPWSEVSDSSGYLKPLIWHQQRWQDYPQNQEIWVYCGSGVTACVNLLSLKIAGYERVKLYPGGWSDWCSHLDC